LKSKYDKFKLRERSPLSQNNTESFIGEIDVKDVGNKRKRKEKEEESIDKIEYKKQFKRLSS